MPVCAFTNLRTFTNLPRTCDGPTVCMLCGVRGVRRYATRCVILSARLTELQQQRAAEAMAAQHRLATCITALNAARSAQAHCGYFFAAAPVEPKNADALFTSLDVALSPKLSPKGGRASPVQSPPSLRVPTPTNIWTGAGLGGTYHSYACSTGAIGGSGSGGHEGVDDNHSDASASDLSGGRRLELRPGSWDSPAATPVALLATPTLTAAGRSPLGRAPKTSSTGKRSGARKAVGASTATVGAGGSGSISPAVRTTPPPSARSRRSRTSHGRGSVAEPGAGQEGKLLPAGE